MATIESRKLSALKLNEEKIKLEASLSPKIRRSFRNMAQDAEALYKTTGSIPAQELAQNYYPEFLVEVRNSMRAAIKQFGFALRIDIEGKNLIFFDAEYKRNIFGLEMKEIIRIEETNLQDKVQSINTEFSIAATLFIANESENQTRFITETNAKEILLAQEQEEIAFASEIAAQARNLAALQTAQELALGRDRVKINRQIRAAIAQLNRSNDNQREIIAKNIKTNLLAKSQSRSDLIASQNVGLAESWSRQTEAELIDDANLVSDSGQSVNIFKEWIAILDSSTRLSHASADGQITRVRETFIVDGENLLYPRDPNGSAGNIINCRCLSNNFVETA